MSTLAGNTFSFKLTIGNPLNFGGYSFSMLLRLYSPEELKITLIVSFVHLIVPGYSNMYIIIFPVSSIISSVIKWIKLFFTWVNVKRVASSLKT